MLETRKQIKRSEKNMVTTFLFKANDLQVSIDPPEMFDIVLKQQYFWASMVLHDELIQPLVERLEGIWIAGKAIFSVKKYHMGVLELISREKRTADGIPHFVEFILHALDLLCEEKGIEYGLLEKPEVN
jgi:hypothetical protein